MKQAQIMCSEKDHDNIKKFYYHTCHFVHPVRYEIALIFLMNTDKDWTLIPVRGLCNMSVF